MESEHQGKILETKFFKDNDTNVEKKILEYFP